MRLLGVQIANGFASEARVLAGVLGQRAYGDALVLYHDWPGDRASASRFQQMARVQVAKFDTGWRPPRSGVRAIPGKAIARTRRLVSLSALRKAAHRYNPDVIVSNQQRWDCAVATDLARNLHRPQVIYLHYTIGPWLGKQTLERLRTCDHIIAVSDFIRGQALDFGIAPDRVTTIRNSMDPLPRPPAGTRERIRAALHIATDALVIGFVGRLDPYKGHAEAIEAFSWVAQRHPDAHLVIAGRGEIEQELAAQARTTPHSERIHFLGQRSDVHDLLASFDVFTHPSYDDPCPLAVLEAAAFGLPVAAFHSGGIPELVADQDGALLAAPGDIEVLAHNLHRLLSDEKLRQRMGCAARSRVRRELCPERAASEFTCVLQRVMAARPCSA